jgi:hypothetical protein
VLRKIVKNRIAFSTRDLRLVSSVSLHLNGGNTKFSEAQIRFLSNSISAGIANQLPWADIPVCNRFFFFLLPIKTLYD